MNTSLDQQSSSATAGGASQAPGSPRVGVTAPENSTSGTPSSGGSARRSTTLQGPCYLKLLVNNLVAGSIIGKNGAVIASIEQQTGCTLKLSPSNSYFPGTQERVVVMSGEQEHINNALLVILDKIREVAAQHTYDPTASNFTGSSPSKVLCKMAVPKSTVSAIIGKGGQQIKQLQESTGARVQISSREEGLNERTVTISGPFDSLQNAALTVAASLQADANLKDHMYVVYKNGSLSGMGVAPGTAGLAGMPGSPLGSPQQYNQFAGYYTSAGAYGSPGSQHYAQQAVAGGVPGDMVNQHCEIIMQIPDVCVGPVIGKNGLSLSEIIHSSGARVQVSQKGELIPGTQDRKVVISGGVAAVHNAHIMMLQRLEAAQNQSKQQNSNQNAAAMASCAMGMHLQGMTAHQSTARQQGTGMAPQQHLQYNQIQTGYGF